MSPDWQPDPDETPGDLEHMQDAAQGANEDRAMVTCCESGRCEVCTPGFVWAVHG